MVHVAQDLVSIQYDLVTGFSLDVGYESNTTTILLVAGIVEAVFCWKCMSICFGRHDFFILRRCRPGAGNRQQYFLFPGVLGLR